MTYFLYLALGDKKYVKEACYAIASLISTNQNTDMPYRIAFMVTNPQAIHPQLAQNELIDIFHISDDIMRDWIGPLGYVYRVKIMAIKMLFACHPDSNIIFIDTDTVILKDLSPLMRHVDNGGFLMYSQCQDITKVIQMTEHVEKSQISKLEKGKCVITLPTMSRVFKALGITTATLDLGVAGKVALW